MIWCYRHYKVSLLFVYITQWYLYQSENFSDICWSCMMKFSIYLFQRVAGNILNFRINYHLRWWFIIHALHVDLLTFIIYYNRKHKRSYNGFNSFCLMIVPNRRMRLVKKRHNFYLVARSAQIISIIIVTNYPVKFHATWARNSYKRNEISHICIIWYYYNKVYQFEVICRITYRKYRKN